MEESYGWWRNINDLVATRVTLAVSTMMCVYIFLAWSLLPLVVPRLESFVFYVSGGILQLIFLPLILVGQNLLSKEAENRAQQDHEAIMEILSDIQEDINSHQLLTRELVNLETRLNTIEQEILSAQQSLPF